MHTTQKIEWDNSGWSPDRQREFDGLSLPGLQPGRVIGQFGQDYAITYAGGFLRGAVSGSYGYLVDLGVRELPVIGDYVGISPEGRVEELLPRTSAFTRLRPGTVSTAQVMVANVDLFVIVTAADRDLSANRVERFLQGLWGTTTALVLVNKMDLAEEPAALISELARRLPQTQVAGVSTLSGLGFDVFEPWLAPGTTIALLGSSGVGKSSMIRRLAGRTDITVASLRTGGKGRHTTSDRRIYPGPEGALLVDLPGVREVGLQGDGLGSAFSDLDQLAAECRYRDCTHSQEPGCALRAAVETGSVERERFEHYLRLRREAESTTEAIRARKKAREKEIGKAIRTFRKPGRDTR